MYMGSVRDILPRERFRFGENWFTCLKNVAGLVVTREGKSFKYNRNMINTDTEQYVYLTANRSNDKQDFTTITNKESGVVHVAYLEGLILCGGRFTELAIVDDSMVNCKRCLEMLSEFSKEVIL